MFDTSGSMYGTIDNLAGDLIERAKSLPCGDTITLGRFSGTGDFNFMLKGFKIADKMDVAVIEKMVKKEAYARGTTCFSGILNELDQVVAHSFPAAHRGRTR